MIIAKLAAALETANPGTANYNGSFKGDYLFTFKHQNGSEFAMRARPTNSADEFKLIVKNQANGQYTCRGMIML